MLGESSEYAGQCGRSSDEHKSINVSDFITKLNHVYTTSLLHVDLEWIKHGFFYAFSD